jgi:hypothetical protein
VIFNRPAGYAALVLLCLAFLVVFIWLFSVPAHAQPQHALEGTKILILHSHEANTPVLVGTDRTDITYSITFPTATIMKILLVQVMVSLIGVNHG